MKPSNIKSLKAAILIWIGFLIPLLFISWSIYLILSLRSEQATLTRLVVINLSIAEIDNKLHNLEKSISGIHVSDSKQDVEAKWKDLSVKLKEQIAATKTLVAQNDLQDVSSNINQIEIEADRMNSIFTRLIDVREKKNNTHLIEEELRDSWHVAYQSAKAALQGIRSRQRAVSNLLVSRTTQLNYIVIISCAFSLFSFIVFVLYRRNIVKRKFVEEALSASEERFSKAFHFSPYPISITEFESGRILDVNEKFLQMTGYLRDELIGRFMKDVEFFSNYPQSEQIISGIEKANGGVQPFEIQCTRKDGTQRTVIISLEVIEIEGKRCIIKAFDNVTESRQSEEALRHSEERFYKAFQANPYPMTISEIESGIYIDVNESFARHLGYARDELIGRSAFDIGLWNSFSERRDLVEQLKTNGTVTNFEATLRDKIGQQGTYLLSATLIGVNGRKCLLGALIDITDRKRSQVRRNLQYAVTQILSEAVTVEDAMSQLVRVICETLDWDFGSLGTIDLQKQSMRFVDLWVSPLVPHDTTPYPNGDEVALSSLAQGIIDSKESVWGEDITKNPGYAHAEWAEQHKLNTILAFPIVVDSEVSSIIAIFNRNNLQRDEELITMSANLGKQIGHFIERKRAETALKMSEERLQQAQKMEAIGRLAGGIAHDFNNILTAIIGYSDLTMRRLETDSPLRHNIEEVKKAALRASSLTTQLLAFSRKQVLQPKTLNLNEAVSHVDQMLKRLLGEDIQLLTILDPKLFPVKTDPTQIELALLNLAVNARDAMPNGGKMTIETANVTLDENYTRSRSDVIPGDYVMLAVSDTGHGIDEETQTHIFEPFFTTKPKGKGTGLGLSTVYGIVKQSKGHVWFYTEVDKGTTFKIYLPRVQDGVVEVKEEKTVDFLTKGWETILLVEDEDAVRNATKAILTMCGYNVLEANDGLAALDVCANYKEPIHLVLTDVVMPRMNGSELATRLSTTLPNTKILFMSGYTDDAIIHHGVLEEGINFIEKPFIPDALARKIREVLG